MHTLLPPGVSRHPAANPSIAHSQPNSSKEESAPVLGEDTGAALATTLVLDEPELVRRHDEVQVPEREIGLSVRGPRCGIGSFRVRARLLVIIPAHAAVRAVAIPRDDLRGRYRLEAHCAAVAPAAMCHLVALLQRE